VDEIMTIDKILKNSISRYSRRKAVVLGREKINYSELYEYINRVSSGIVGLGIEEGDKVGILLKNSIEFIVSYFAILKAGAIVVPINYMFKEEEIKYILENSECCTVISSSEFISTIKRLRLRLDKLKHVIVVAKEIEGTIGFAKLLNSDIDKTTSISSISEEKVAVILYTSGTTGHPKGVMLTHRNLYSNVVACSKTIKLSRKDRFLCFLPMFHSFTWTVCVLVPLYIGATIFILDSIKPFKRVARCLIKNRITIFVAIPPIYNILTSIKIPRVLTLRIFKFFLPLRICISGASSLSINIIKKFEFRFRVPLLEGYGLTEASPVVSINPLKRRKRGSVGLTLPGVEIRVVDDDGNSLPFDIPGELLVKGENVMKGYYRLPKETSEVLQNGWLYTGDIAKLDENGYIYIVDRKTDLIIVRGQNVYPREIEETLYLNPKVAEAAVIGIKDELKGEIPKAFISLRENEDISERELLNFLRQRIAFYKVPRSIQFMDSLPKSPTGKILKKELRKWE